MEHQIIRWEQAHKIDQENKEKQAKALQSFLEEDCSMLDERDFIYYSERTGKPIEYLLKVGKNVDFERVQVYNETGELPDPGFLEEEEDNIFTQLGISLF